MTSPRHPSGTAVSIRLARPADASRLAAFATRAFTDTYAAHNTPENMRDYLASAYGEVQQRREITDPLMATVIAESGAEIVGYAQVRRKGVPPCVTVASPAEIYRFYVDKSAHGKGVAQELMRETLVAAKHLGARHAWLGVWEKNARAIAFYMKSGFRDVGTQIFQLGDDPQTDRVLVVELGS